MASVVLTGLFNARADFLFSKLNHTGCKAEMKRHNKALEDLKTSKEQFHETHM